MRAPTGRSRRLAAILVVSALAIAACATDDPGPDPDVEVALDPATDDPGARVATYDVGMFQDMAVDSWWGYLDNADGWSGFVLSGTACQLFELTPPTFAITPQLAVGDLPEPRLDGDTWVVEVEIHDGVSWSDGTPVTAHDMAFTWRTVVDLPLGGQWLTYYEPAALDAGRTTSIEAADDTTVRIEFSDEPGLATWPMALALASIMPEHHWGPIVDGASGPEDLLGTSGIGAPSCGPYLLDEWEEGAYARVVANDQWFLSGAEYTHHADGTVHIASDRLGVDGRFGSSTGEGGDEVVATYVTGPYADEVVYTVYGSAAVAVSALAEGEVSFLLTGPGLDAGAQDRLFDADDVEVVVNPNYNLQFLGFNLERAPMSDLAFREAVATVIDREHITRTILGGSAFPLYTRMPSGNTAWYSQQDGDRIRERWEADSQAQRVERAVEILREAGYTWEVQPVVDESSGDIVERGVGVVGPDGVAVPRLEIIHPTAGYDPLRNVAGLFVGQFIGDLGFDVVTRPTEFSQLVGMVINPDDLRYDMVITGWGLGNPALPTYFDAFWRGGAPLNIVAYASDEYDEAVARFMAATDLSAAHDVLWNELEPILDRDLPYVPLFESAVVEGYRPGDVSYQFTDLLGGIGRTGGLRDTVMAPR